MKEWEQCFEEGVQFAEVDDGDNEGYEPVTAGDDRHPGADEVWREKVLVRLLVMVDMKSNIDDDCL